MRFTTPQQKAGYTNRARNAFYATYGERAYNVVRMLLQGTDPHEISALTGLTTRSIAAYQANLTRGAYQNFKHTDGTSFALNNCNW